MAKFTLEGTEDRLESYVECTNRTQSNKLVAVGLLTKSMNSRKFQDFAQHILGKFRDQYHDQILHWDGNLNTFELFTFYISQQIQSEFAEEEKANTFLEISSFDQQLDDILSRAVEGELSALTNLDGYLDSFTQ